MEPVERVLVCAVPWPQGAEVLQNCGASLARSKRGVGCGWCRRRRTRARGSHLPVCYQTRAKWGGTSINIPIEEHGVFPLDSIQDVRDVEMGKYGGE